MIFMEISDLSTKFQIKRGDDIRKMLVEYATRLNENCLIMRDDATQEIYVLPRGIAEKTLGPDYQSRFKENPYLFLQSEVLDNFKLGKQKISEGVFLLKEKEIGPSEIHGMQMVGDDSLYVHHMAWEKGLKKLFNKS